MNIIQINDLSDPALSVYTGLNEAQLKHYYEPAPGLFICESPKVIGRALNAGYEAVSFLAEEKYLSALPAALAESIPVYTAPLPLLTRITGYHLTGGLLCAMRRKKPLPAELLLKDICEKNGGRSVRLAILEDIENPTNVGAVFRSAAALGIDAVLLTEGCSDPLYRRAARVSVGTVFQIPWTWIGLRGVDEDRKHYIDFLHASGFKTAAMALSEKTIFIDDSCLKAEEKLAVILGNEENGLLPETISKSDFAVKIPMPEGIDSLNVAAASAVAFWELRK